MNKPQLTINLFHPRHWISWVGFFILKSFSYLPYSVMKRLSLILSYLTYNFASRRTNIIETNICRCFPKKTTNEKRTLSHAAFTSSIMAIFEFSLSWWGTKKRLAKLHRVEGMEHLTNALKKGKGVILLSSHFTTMEITGAFLGSHIDNLVVTYKRSNNPLLEYFIQRQRLENCAGLIKHKSLRKIIQSIRQGNVLWFAPDQDCGRKNSIFAPFMGIETSTLLSTHRIAKITGAPVIPLYGERLDEESTYIVHISPELKNFPSSNELHDATLINQAIEKQIKQTPEQYLWGHRRFKTRPDGEMDFYTK